jgi:hypothetical protein
MTSVSKLHKVDDRMINKYGTVGGTRIGRGYLSTKRKPSLAHNFMA